MLVCSGSYIKDDHTRKKSTIGRCSRKIADHDKSILSASGLSRSSEVGFFDTSGTNLNQVLTMQGKGAIHYNAPTTLITVSTAAALFL